MAPDGAISFSIHHRIPLHQEELLFDFKARYFKLGKLDASTKQLWFVVHGYGQLAEFFIKKFQRLEDAGICVLAPEGLSRFYLAGSSGRVGASWMTKENRLMDIENYIHYLNEIYFRETVQMTTLPPITLLGFSQGAATVSRWLMDGKIKADRLILWAGLFPPDMDFEKGKSILNQLEVYEVYGENDPYITEESKQQMTILNEKLGLHPLVMTFDGKHELDQNILAKFL